jgi:hypothetical protein
MSRETIKLPGLRSNLIPPNGMAQKAFIRQTIESLLGIALPELAGGAVFYHLELPDGWRIGHPEGDFRRGLINPDGHFLVSIHDRGVDSKLIFEARYRAILFFSSMHTSEDLRNDPAFHSGEYGRQKVTWVIKDDKLGSIIYPPSGEMLMLETNKEALDRQRVKVQKTVDEWGVNWLDSWELQIHS